METTTLNFNEPIPLFPLPGCVLFPHVLLPLHVFEPRYRAMMQWSLDHQKLMAIALLKPGYEADYEQSPDIHIRVCVGRIVNHEVLDDGRSNLMLQGLARADVLSETLTDEQFRLANLEPCLSEPMDDGHAHRAAQDTLLALLKAPGLSRQPAAEHLLELFGNMLNVDALSDLIAFHLIPEPPAQQRLLNETSVATRVAMLERLLPVVAERAMGNESGWPPSSPMN